MEVELEHVSPAVQAEVDHAANKLRKPGVIFGEPLQDGRHTLIPVMKTVERRGAVVTRPVAVILVSGEKVRVKLLQRGPAERVLMVLAMTGLIGAIPVLLFPPWRPDTNLLEEVGKLIRTIRSI
jgi:hypothetical protein